jgi:hypothetical protein
MTTPPKFELIPHDNGFHDDHWAVKIVEGDYKGLVYQYDVVKINEDEVGNGAELKFNTITIENPYDVDLTLEIEKGILGSILLKIIEDNLESENFAKEEKEKNEN